MHFLTRSATILDKHLHDILGSPRQFDHPWGDSTVQSTQVVDEQVSFVGPEVADNVVVGSNHGHHAFAGDTHHLWREEGRGVVKGRVKTGKRRVDWRVGG